jgi:rare lipoprotein A
MRGRTAQGLTLALFVGLGAAQGPTSSGSAIHNSAGTDNALQRAYLPAPARVNSPAFQVGTASWYGEDFVGKPTASGEPYNMYELTAAHPTLPLGTMVKVTNLRNRRCVIVRINDRGPVVEGRIIDVSYSAARVLNFQAQGIQRVRLDLVSPKRPATQLALLREPVLGQ